MSRLAVLIALFAGNFVMAQSNALLGNYKTMLCNLITAAFMAFLAWKNV